MDPLTSTAILAELGFAAAGAGVVRVTEVAVEIGRDWITRRMRKHAPEARRRAEENVHAFVLDMGRASAED
jgi:hypothetical protein